MFLARLEIVTQEGHIWVLKRCRGADLLNIYYKEVLKMTQQERYQKYRKEICKYCKNPDCENGKGIDIFSVGNVIHIRCTDYITDIKREKIYWLPWGVKYKYKRKKY